jgi:hypothetical protein
MSKQTLKELIKLPFVYNGDMIFSSDKAASLDVFYKGALSDFGDWAADALNEKAERDFGEPMRWREKRAIVRCPKCDFGAISYSNYCPSCGQRLLPAEEK